MFSQSARYYDAIYSFKDYKTESEKIIAYIQQYASTEAHTLLDIACGTGEHARYLADQYQLTGIDIDDDLLDIARGKLPQVQFHVADMRDFALDSRFDVITCLFSAIAYVVTPDALHQTIKNMANHLSKGGVLLVEPWFSPGVMENKRVSVLTVEGDNFKIVRMARTTLIDNVSTLNFEYLIGTADGIQHLTERHEMGLFSHDEYQQAFMQAGLTVHYDEDGISGRGMYIGTF